MKYNIAVIRGDGIGPEIVDQTLRVLDKIGEKFNHEFNYEYLLAGGCSIDEYGIPLTDEVLDKCRKSDSVLLGAVGGPKWDSVENARRPEKALLALRNGLGLYANIRPAIVYDSLRKACPIKDEISSKGIDICICRELTGGIYFGERHSDGVTAYDVEKYSKNEIERIAVRAFETAMKRRKKVTSVDKANVLETSRLWRKTVEEIAEKYPEVELNHMYVDNASMQLIKNPSQFDVIVTSNMFGDILSDEASMITGSIGMLPSMSLGEGTCGMYEPIHGSAPDIAGKNIANPLATILSAAMMLRYSFDLADEADAIETAVDNVLSRGCRTADIAAYGEKTMTTAEITDEVIKEL